MLAKWIPKLGRMHASCRLVGAARGRISCGKPHLQDIQRGAACRCCNRPTVGRVRIKADDSQIELRIAGQVSRNKAIQEAGRSGEDLHSKNALAALVRESTAHDRRPAKSLNFGLLYVTSAERLRTYARDDYGVRLSETEGVHSQQRLFQTYPSLRTWHGTPWDGEVTALTLSGQPLQVGSAFMEKLNPPVQRTGATILKRAPAQLRADRAEVPAAVHVLGVHDEFVIELRAKDAEHGSAWIVGHSTAAGAKALPDYPIAFKARVVADKSGMLLG
jgi:DNA polymerase-1